MRPVAEILRETAEEFAAVVDKLGLRDGTEAE